MILLIVVFMYRARDEGLSFISVVEIDGTLVFLCGKGDTDKEIEMIYYALGKVVDTIKFEDR